MLVPHCATAVVNCASALGIVLQPSFLVSPHLALGTLVEILPQHRGIDLSVYAVYRSCKHLTPKVRVLIDLLVRALGTPVWVR